MNSETGLRRADAESIKRHAVAPLVDVYENANELLILADIPGVEKEALAVRIDQDTLTLEARRKDGALGAVPKGQEREIEYHRVFSLPKGIDAERISASLKDGTVEIRLPKSEKVKPRQIRINAG